MESCNRELLDLKRNCEDGTYHILNDIGVLYLKCLQLHAALEAFLGGAEADSGAEGCVGILFPSYQLFKYCGPAG